MNTETQEVCGLCFKIVTSLECMTPNQSLIEMLDVLHIQKLTSDDADSKVCTICVEKVKDAFHFKTMCLERKDSYSKTQIDKIESANMEVCLLCRQFINKNDAIFLLEMLKEKDMIEAFHKYIPEIDLGVTQNPLVCEPCGTSVINFSNFVFLLTDVDIQYEENKGFDKLMNSGKNSEIRTDILVENRGEKDTDLKENAIIKIKTEICEDITEFSITGKCIVKEEVINEDNSYMVEVKNETAGDTPFCDYETMNIKAKETIIVKTETDGDNYISDTEMYDYGEYQLKSEEIDLKTEPGQSMSDGSGTKVIQRQKEHERMYIYENDSHKSILKSQTFTDQNTKEANIYKCLDCTYETNMQSNQEVHCLIHQNRNEVIMHKCQQCFFQTKHKSSLRKHMLTHKNADEIQIYGCEQCTFQTKLRGNLKAHMLIHQDIDEVKMHRCQQCSFQTKYKGSLFKHLLTHKNSDETDIYKCHECTFQTKYKCSIREHMLIHRRTDEAKIYSCQDCIYRTHRINSLKKHLLVHQSIDEAIMHRCQQCSFQTKRKASLKKHSLTHLPIDEVKTYQCQECSYKTKIKSNLKKHLIIHQGVNGVIRHICHKCGFKTNYDSTLREHLLIHQNIQQPKTYKCTNCTYQTNIKKNFKAHSVVHQHVDEATMHKCEKCTFQTKHKGNLKTHMSSHRNDEPCFALTKQ